ncbi:MAG: hypothetical protein AAF253_12555 [Pseudomonadota bacterium]
MHPVAAGAAVLAIAPLAVTAPVFGFALVTAGVAGHGYLTHNAAKLRVERGFFVRGEAPERVGLRIRTTALINAVLRALAVGLLALFTFPPLAADEVARNGPLADYGAQMSAERLPTIAIVFLSIGLGVLITLGLGRLIRAAPARWALYRLGLVFGLVFSALTTLASLQSDRIVAALPAEHVSEGVTLYAAPQTLAVLDAVRGLHDELSTAEQKRAGLDHRSRACARDFWLDIYDLRGRLNRATWRCDDYRAAVDPLPIAQTAILTMAVFDDLIDGLVADLVASVAGSFSPEGGPVSSMARVSAAVVLSSNLLQGFVLAVYIAPLAGAVGRPGAVGLGRRRRARREAGRRSGDGEPPSSPAS